MLYKDLEARVRLSQAEATKIYKYKCQKCGSDYFETVEYAQYVLNTRSALGQRPAAATDKPRFWVLRCICGELYEPPVSRIPDKIDRMYDDFLDVVTKVNK